MANVTPSRSTEDTLRMCDGLFTMPLPPGWRYDPRGYTDGTITMPRGQHLFCAAESFDAPEAIATGALRDFVAEPDWDEPAVGADEVTRNILLFLKRARADAPPELVWKTADVLQDRYIRIIRFALPLESEDGGEPAARSRIATEVTAAVSQGVFADVPKPLDRVAPTKTLKRVAPWGLIYMRVPSFWRYERVEDGRFVCDVLPQDAPPDPTLWFDYNLFSAPDSELILLDHVHETAEGLAVNMGPPDQVKLDLDDGGAWIECIGGGEEGETALVFYNMHRLVAEAPHFITAQFSLVMTALDAKSSAGRDIVDLIYNEIHNAIVLARPPPGQQG